MVVDVALLEAGFDFLQQYRIIHPTTFAWTIGVWAGCLDMFSKSPGYQRRQTTP